MTSSAQLSLRRLGHGSHYYPGTSSTSIPAQIDLSNTAAQPDCVLFARLPGEIRNDIFEYALTPDANPEKPYARNRIYYRPYLQYHPKTNIALLQTCKLVFEETRYMPVAQATHYFWVFGGPLSLMRSGIPGMAGWDSWQESLSPEQRRAVRHVHLFVQQYYLEGFGTIPILRPWHFATKSLTLTLRHSDWWSWQSPSESSDRLGICPWRKERTSHQKMLAQPVVLSHDEMRQRMVEGTWGWQVGQVQGLQSLEIEFETDAEKQEQLEKVLERAKHWVFPLSGRNAALIQCGDVVESYWDANADLRHDEQHSLRHTSKSSQEACPMRTCYVAVMTWRAASETSEEYLAKTVPVPHPQ